MLRQEGNVCGLDLFVEVPQGAAARKLTHSIKCRRKRAKEASCIWTAANQFFDRGRSARG